MIQDGVSDRPLPELNGLTPLQVARKPNMDSIANNGIAGIMDVIEPGVRLGTDTGYIALFLDDIPPVLHGKGFKTLPQLKLI